MKRHSSLLRTRVLLSVVPVFFCCFVSVARGQQEPDPDSNTTVAAKFPAAKRRTGHPTPVADANADTTKSFITEKDTADTISKREHGFYKLRAAPKVHRAAGAPG